MRETTSVAPPRGSMGVECARYVRHNCPRVDGRHKTASRGAANPGRCLFGRTVKIPGEQATSARRCRYSSSRSG